MSMLKTAILLSTLSLLSACAVHKAAPPIIADAVPPRTAPKRVLALAKPDTDPEKALRSALDAYKTGNGEAALLIARQLSERYPTPWTSVRCSWPGRR
jgi:hypothetical protein